MNRNESIILIPAYNPTENLLRLLQDIKTQTNFKIIIINDGSSSEYASIFEKASEYASTITHKINKGKGQAIKTALEHIKNTYPIDTIITLMDADSLQNTEDIISVTDTAKKAPDSLILGSRKLNGKLSFKNKFKNLITSLAIRMISGHEIMDTQTGLRSFSAQIIPFLLTAHGNNYENNRNMLLSCIKNGINIVEIPIDNPIENPEKISEKKSGKAYKNLIKFCITSISSFLLDFSVYSMLLLLTKDFSSSTSLLLSNIVARIVSASFNFYINKKFVFQNHDSVLKTGLKYFGLALFIIGMNTALLSLLVEYLHLNPFIGKILVEGTLFFFSWMIQRIFVFQKHSIAVKYANARK